MGLFQAIGALLLVGICIASGAMKVQAPESFVKDVMAGGLPKLIAKFGVEKAIPGFKFGPAEAKVLVLAVGAVMCAASALIVVNVARRYFAVLLALVLAAVTICQHVNVTDPAKTSQVEMIQVFKNVAIIGGLIFVAGTDGNNNNDAPANTSANNKSKRE